VQIDWVSISELSFFLGLLLSAMILMFGAPLISRDAPSDMRPLRARVTAWLGRTVYCYAWLLCGAAAVGWLDSRLDAVAPLLWLLICLDVGVEVMYRCP